jgi:FKBP-type peptidyl-prolyl cis-trans isomerase (trigger factor)
MSDNSTYKILKKEEKSKSEIELEIELPVSTLNKFREDSIKELSQDVKADGFRKGHVPEKMVLEKVGEMTVLERCTYKSINNIVPIVITNEKLDALIMPAITITKIAVGSPLVFKMTVTLFPQIELPDYKTVAKEIEEPTEQKVEQKEVDEYIEYLRKQRAQTEAMSKNKKIDPEKLELPELDDEFVKTLGNFKSVDEFRKELEKNMLASKVQREKEKRRMKIIEKIIEQTKVDLPDMLVDEEVERMMSKFKFDIQQFKMEPEEYLKEIKKTEEDLKKEWKPDAEKRVKMNLILPKIAEKEKLQIDQKEVEKEVEHIKHHEKNIDENHARMYVSSVLMNEAVFKFLEEQK